MSEELRVRRQSQGRYAVTFAGCTTDDGARAEASQLLHDRLVAANPIRLGPVVWRYYRAQVAEEILADVGVIDHPHAPGLLAFLADTPDSELVIAMVEVPES